MLFFKQKTAYEMRISDWSSDVCSSDLSTLICVVAKTDPTGGAKGTSLVMVETEEVEGFRRGRNLDKIGMHAQDTSELFFDDVKVPTSNLLGTEEIGKASVRESMVQYV